MIASQKYMQVKWMQPWICCTRLHSGPIILSWVTQTMQRSTHHLWRKAAESRASAVQGVFNGTTQWYTPPDLIKIQRHASTGDHRSVATQNGSWKCRCQLNMAAKVPFSSWEGKHRSEVEKDGKKGWIQQICTCHSLRKKLTYLQNVSLHNHVICILIWLSGLEVDGTVVKLQATRLPKRWPQSVFVIVKLVHGVSVFLTMTPVDIFKETSEQFHQKKDISIRENALSSFNKLMLICYIQ